MIANRFLAVLASYLLVMMLASSSFLIVVIVHSQTATTSPNNKIYYTWPQASDLPLQKVTTLTGLKCDVFNLANLFPAANSSLIVLDSIISDTVIFPTSFSLRNASIKFINTRLRFIRQRNSFMSLLSGASLEFHNCIIEPRNEHQPAISTCDASGCSTTYYDAQYYAQGLQLMIAQNSFEYDIIIKGCTYRFVSQDKSFLLNASMMPSAFGIKLRIEPNKKMLSYSFRNIYIVDNYFETNHGTMDLFALRFEDGDDEYRLLCRNGFSSRQLTGDMINISGNTVVMRQIEGDDLMLLREKFNTVLGPQLYATLQLGYMVFDDNKIDIRGVTLASNFFLTVLSQGPGSLNGFLGMRLFSICRNKVTVSPTFSPGLYRGFNSSADPQFAVSEVRFLSIYGLNRVDEVIINDNDVFITTSNTNAFHLAVPSASQLMGNSAAPATSASIGSVTISNNKIECRDTLVTTSFVFYCFRSSEDFGSFVISHNNFTAVTNQQKSNFTSYLNREFRGTSFNGIVFQGSGAASLQVMRNVGRMSTTYNTIHLEGMPQLLGFANYVNLQDCKFSESSFNNITLILDDRTDRPFDFARATDTQYGSFGYGLRISLNVLRISKVEIQQNIILVVSRAGANDLTGIDVTSAFDPRNRPAAELNPFIVPSEFKDRPELIYKNVSIWNNTVKMLALGSQSLGLLQSPIRVGAQNASIDIGYFYVFSNTLAVLTNEPSPSSGTNGITIVTTGYTRNFSAVIISNNKIRVSGVSKVVSGVNLQASNNFDAADLKTLGKLFFADGDTRNFKKLIVENNDIRVSNLKGAAAAISFHGAGVLQLDNLELRKNTVLLTARSLTEYFGNDPVFSPYQSFPGIDMSKFSSFPQDQHSYFYALCPYGNLFGIIALSTKNGFAISVGKMTIENEKITLEKSGSFVATKLGFYITDSLNVRNINMKSLGIVDSSYRQAAVSSIFSIDSSSLGFQGLEYFSSVFPRITKINISNSIFSIQLPSSCSDILNSNDKATINNQLSFINILPAPSTTVPTTIVGDLIIQNVAFTQDCSTSSSMPSLTSTTNSIINVPRAVTQNTRTSINVTELNIFSLPKQNVFMSAKTGNLISSTSTSSSLATTTSATIECSRWNKIMILEISASRKYMAANFVSDSSLLHVGCSRFVPSRSATKATVESRSIESTPSRSKGSRTRVVRQDSSELPLAESLFEVLISSANAPAPAVGQILGILAGDPAMALSVARGAILYRLASCYVQQKDTSPDQLRPQLDKYATTVLTTDLGFPRSFLPGVEIGAHQGGFYRGGLIGFIFLLPLIVAVMILVWGLFNQRAMRIHREERQSDKRRASSSSSPSSSSSREKSDPLDSLKRCWDHAPIDRCILLPLTLVAPLWSDLAGGMLAARPGGGGDIVVAVVPILINFAPVIFITYNLCQLTSCERKRGKVAPKNFLAKSDVYASERQLEEKIQTKSVLNFLRSSAGRFLFVGDNCWANNPALVYLRAETSIADLVLHRGSGSRWNNYRSMTNAFASESTSTKQFGEARRPPIAGFSTNFGSSLTTFQPPLKLSESQELAFSKIEAIRRRHQIFWTQITYFISFLITFLGGFAAVDPSQCYSFFFVAFTFCIVDLVLLSWLRPFVVPSKTVSNLAIDVGTFIGGCVLCGCVASSELAPALAGLMSVGRNFSTLPGAILGPMALCLSAVRTALFLQFKIAVVPKSTIPGRRRDEHRNNNNDNNHSRSNKHRGFLDEPFLETSSRRKCRDSADRERSGNEHRGHRRESIQKYDHQHARSGKKDNESEDDIDRYFRSRNNKNNALEGKQSFISGMKRGSSSREMSSRFDDEELLVRIPTLLREGRNISRNHREPVDEVRNGSRRRDNHDFLRRHSDLHYQNNQTSSPTSRSKERNYK